VIRDALELVIGDEGRQPPQRRFDGGPPASGLPRNHRRNPREIKAPYTNRAIAHRRMRRVRTKVFLKR
jgi:hypothetical protein